MRISAWWLLAALIVGLGAAYIFYNFFYIPVEAITVKNRTNYNVITFRLPNSRNTAIFGPQYWKANEYLDKNLPCSLCSDKAVPLGSFKHDIVNLMTGKNVFNKDNWKYWIDKVNELDKKVPA